MDELYVALMELEQEQRKMARTVRHSAEDAQVDAMLDEADHIERAAMWSAVGEATTGVMSIASAGARIDGDAATAGCIDGSAKLASGGFSYLAGVQQAEQKRSAARAAAQGQVAQDARDVEERAREMTQTLQRRLEQAEEAQNASMAAILRA
jgi:hypothetical protein